MLESYNVRSVNPYRDRSYEWVIAVATFAVDPEDESNGRIVDLGRAPRDHDGMVRFESDVRLLRPTRDDSGRTLVVIPNRGMLGGIPFSLDAVAAPGPTEDPDPGDGLLLEQGWTVAWCGWQWDVLRSNGWIGLDAPRAVVEPGWMRIEFRPDVNQASHRLSDSSPLFQFSDYPTIDSADTEAFLTVRTAPLGPKEIVPRGSWRFVDDHEVRLDGGFQPFHWYELVYRSDFAPVVGSGLLAIRDFGSQMREWCDDLFAFGISQSGRFLREFLFDGLNLDESGRQVFDGVFCHIAGARRGEFNCRFGQPSLTHPLTPGYGPPYDTAGLLEHQRAVGGVPKLFSVNSSWEYWRGDGALVHQDPMTGSDLPEDSATRSHLLSGTDHFGPFPLKEFLPAANPTHMLDVVPILRALFVQLVEWVCDGAEPSPSCVPRLSDGTAVDRNKVLAVFGEGALPDPDQLPWTPFIDPNSTSWPLQLGEPMVALVSDVDAAGNERAGIRLPAVGVPASAYTGWNPRRPIPGLPDVLYEFVGSRLPLQDHSTLPGRPSYARSVRHMARSMVAGRFLLERDLERVVAQALKLFDDVAPSGAPG